MPEEASAVELRPHVRLIHGMRRPANWLQLVRFGLVGGLGFVVNLAVYTVFVHQVGLEYRVASVVAWIVAVANNFFWNRHWTFDAREGVAHHQAMRFLLVSVVTEVGGHGIGRVMHADPHVSHVGKRGSGLRLKAGMAITVEPMVNLGGPGIRALDDGWTLVTADGSLSAQWEHTVIVTREGYELTTHL